jgi:hypothetical protein
MATPVRTLGYTLQALIIPGVIGFTLFTLYGDRYLPEPLRTSSAQTRLTIQQLIQPFLRETQEKLPDTEQASQKGKGFSGVRCQLAEKCQ